MALAPIRLVRQWSVEGGRLGKAHCLDTKDIDTKDGPVSFVKIDKNADWMLKLVTGSGSKGGLRRSLVFREFETHLKEARTNPDSHWSPDRAPERSSSSADAGASEPAVDPMSQLEDISTEFATPKKKARTGPYYQSKRGQNQIQIVTLPEHELVSHPGRREERKVRLLPLSTNSLYICIEDIDWLARWLNDELRSGGVPLPKNDPLSELRNNCAVEHVHIRWDFSGAWEAIILEGPKKGRTYKCKLGNFDETKWLAVGGDAKYGTDFMRAKPAQRREASFLFLQKHVANLIAADAQAMRS